MTNEQIDEIYNKLSDIGRTDLGDLFLSNPEGFDWSVLENDPNFVEKYKSIEDFTGDKFKIMGNLYNQFNGKKLTPERFEQLRSVYPWLNREEIDAWFDKTNQYKKMYEEEREAEAGKMRRQKEIEDWPWYQKLLASDYSRQRYIDNPDASMFGKEGEYNPYTKEGQEEFRDVVLGGTGAVADLIPGWGALIGPTIRAGRDIYHVAGDSPYKKELQDIIKDAGVDYGTNIGAWVLANARKGAKAAEAIKDPDVARSLNMADETKAIREGLGRMETGVARIPDPRLTELYRGLNTTDPFNDIVLKNYVMDLPESAMKRELIPLVSNIKNRPIDRAAVQEVIQKYQRETMPTVQAEARKRIMENRMLPDEWRNGSDYFESTLASKPFSDLTLKQKAIYGVNRGISELNKGKLGQVAIQEGTTAMGRGSSKPNVIETALAKKAKDDRIQWYIDNYARDWNMGFVPKKQKGDPLWEAYKIYKGITEE